MTLKEIEERLAQIKQEAETDGADIAALTEEADGLIAQRSALIDAAEERNRLINMVLGEGVPVDSAPLSASEKRQGYGADSPQYRTAFLKNLAGVELDAQERAAFTATTGNTAAPIPTAMLNQIWETVSENHCIMEDITMYRTGTVLELVKHTGVVQGKAKKVSENAQNEDEQNTFVKVTLSGNDFSKHVDISYAFSKMSLPALETYIVNEISQQLGEALAEDVITSIKNGIAAENKITAASAAEVTYAEAAKAFGLLKRVSSVKVYVNHATLYNQLVSMTDTTGRPIYQPTAQAGAMGAFIGGIVRVEDCLADGEILIGDPKKFVFNMVQDIMLESDKDIKKHVITHSGYARGEGALMDDKAFALISLKAAAGA